MKEQFDVLAIKEQAKHVKQDCPELFDYLVRRDQGTGPYARNDGFDSTH